MIGYSGYTICENLCSNYGVEEGARYDWRGEVGASVVPLPAAPSVGLARSPEKIP
jgi:hypothetical protein